MKTVVFAFGRMNPPTTGHQKLVTGLIAQAKKAKATPRVYLSHSVGKKDPLPYDKKIAFAKKAFGAIVKKSPARNIIQILQSLEKEGFKKVVLIAGSDRVPEFTRLIKAYNGKEYNFDEIEVISAGERDPDADDVSGMSASKLRALAKDEKTAEFMRGTPSTLRPTDKKSLYTAVRKALLGEDVMDYGHDESFMEYMIEADMKDKDLDMPSDAEINKVVDNIDHDELDLHDTDAFMLDVITGEDDEEDEDEIKDHIKDMIANGSTDKEIMDMHPKMSKSDIGKIRMMKEERKPLSIMQRQKLAMRMRRFAKRLARLRQIKAKIMPAQQRIRLRARKAALMSLRKRAAGTRGLNYSELSPSQRIAVDTALLKRFGPKLKTTVERISKRLLPRIRKQAQASVAQARSRLQTNEAVRHTDIKHSAKDGPLKVDSTQIDPLQIDPQDNDRDAPKPTKHNNPMKKYRNKTVYEARKSAVDKDARDAGDTNIVYQMRKTINSRGEHETVFANGQKASVSVNDAKKMLARFDSLRMPIDKHEFTVQAGKSLSSFRNILMHGLDKSKKPKISLGGRSFREFRAYNKYQPDEPPGVRLVGEAKEDPEIGDRKGAQPAQYHSGLKKSTKIARDQQFKKQTDMSDSDPSAYKPAPGDADAKTRPSKHTLKYRRMYGEAKSSVGGVDPDENDDPNKPRKVDPKLDLLLRLGLVDVDELQKYRRALRSSKKQALQSPEMRKKLADLLDKLLDYTVGDTQTFSRIRYRVQKARSESVEIDEAADAGLAKKAEKSGIPLSILRQVYNRGMAAWKTGHRPGANQQQWAYARVNSFIGKGKGTWGGRDSDLAAKVRKEESSCNMTNEGTMCEVHGTKACPTISELQRSADIKMIKVRLPDGRMVMRRERKPTNVQHDEPKIEAVSPAQQAAIAISMKKAGKKPKNVNEMFEQMSKKDWKHHLDPKLSLKHKMKDAMQHVDRDADGDVDKFDKPEFPDEISVGSEKMNRKMRQKQRGELQHTKIGRAFESYMLQLDRGKNKDALKVTEKGKKGWTEIRGKKGYETSGYSKKDPLHKTLDKVGKAANISDLMNGEKVSINPKHPSAKSAMQHLKKMTKEESQIDEVGYDKLMRYIGKSFKDREKAIDNDDMKKYDKRTRGIRRAGDKAMFDKKHWNKVKVPASGRPPQYESKQKPLEIGTDRIRQAYAAATPGQNEDIQVASFAPEKPVFDTTIDANPEGTKTPASFKDVRKALSGIRESYDINEAFSAGFELAPLAHEYGIQVQSGFAHHPDVEAMMDEATYKGKTVPLNKPMKGDVKKSKVYVDPDGDGKAQKVNFGDKKLSIKKNIPARKKSYCARSSGQGNLTDKTKANYWSRRAWDC